MSDHSLLPQPHSASSECQDSTDGIVPELRQSYWLSALCRHGLLSPELIPCTSIHARTIEGKVRSGWLGNLRYSNLCTNTLSLHMPVVRSEQSRPQDHWVMMQVTGRTTYAVNNQKCELLAGDVMFVNQPSSLSRIDHHGPSELLILHNPLAATAASVMRHIPLSIRRSSSELVRLAFSFCRDLMPARESRSGVVSEDLGLIVSNLLGHVFNQLPTPSDAKQHDHLSHNRVTRQSVEQHVKSRLEDPTLSLASIAQALGCSVRTIHRAFQNESDESLEGHIWKLRIDACANLLRQPDAKDIVLTDLVLRFGFSNSSHFSTVFKRRMGLSPSDYRKAYGPVASNNHAFAPSEPLYQFWSAYNWPQTVR